MLRIANRMKNEITGVLGMSVQFVGDQHIAQEVLFKMRQWDNAVAKMDIDALTELCETDVNLFDVNSQVEGKDAYRTLWEKYCPYFLGQVRVQRKDITIHADANLAFVHCQSKVDSAEPQTSLNLPWCRTTMCFKKQEGKWRLVHQHISLAMKQQAELHQLNNTKKFKKNA